LSCSSIDGLPSTSITLEESYASNYFFDLVRMGLVKSAALLLCRRVSTTGDTSFLAIALPIPKFLRLWNPIEFAKLFLF